MNLDVSFSLTNKALSLNFCLWPPAHHTVHTLNSATPALACSIPSVWNAFLSYLPEQVPASFKMLCQRYFSVTIFSTQHGGGSLLPCFPSTTLLLLSFLKSCCNCQVLSVFPVSFSHKLSHYPFNKYLLSTLCIRPSSTYWENKASALMELIV